MGSDNTYSTNNADNLQEEELWGIPSNVVAVTYKTENRQYTHMDFLSIEQCAKEFIGSQVDAAIWVVDSMEGITDFAKEQVALARNTGVDYIIVFVDGPEYRMELEDEIQEVLNKYDYPGFDTPIVFGFINGALEEPESEWGERILELVEMLDEYVPDPTADRDKTFILSVEDVFKVTGRGTVATGRVEAGVIKVNDRVEIVGFGEKKTAVATGIEMFRVLKDFAEPADNIGLLLRGVEKNEVKRGCVITKPGTAKCCKEFNSVIYFTDSKYFASLTNGSKVNLVIRTAEISGHIIFAEANKNYDGQYVEVNVILSDSIAMETGLRFAVRDERRNVMGFGKVHF